MHHVPEWRVSLFKPMGHITLFFFSPTCILLHKTPGLHMEMYVKNARGVTLSLLAPAPSPDLLTSVSTSVADVTAAILLCVFLCADVYMSRVVQYVPQLRNCSIIVKKKAAMFLQSSV